jgi:N-glycosylase/DNA lyase
MSNILAAAPPYHLRRTLTCGQAFRWSVQADTARGIFAGRVVRLTQHGEAIEVDGLHKNGDLAGLSRYLGLDQPLRQVEQTLETDPVLRRILPSTSGMALIRQDPWECLVSFVVSAFNNIPKIEMTLDRLCHRFGEPLNGTGWSFPSPDRLARATLSELRRCVLGYRAPYVRAIARRVDAGRFDLRTLAALPYDEARTLLLDLPGVGGKVADCVLLFAYGMGEAFPVDVWVRRAVERWYFRGAPKPVREIRAFAHRRFGALAGYAQQHLFYYARQRRI